MSILQVILLLLVFVPQIYTPADFTQVAGSSLKARYDSALAQARLVADEKFWVAYQFPVRPGVRVNTWDGNVNVTRGQSSDGIEFVDSPSNTQRVGLFLLIRKSDSHIERARVLNLNQNYQVRDRRVYWIGEPAGNESLSMIVGLIAISDRRAASQMLMSMSLHDGQQATDGLLQVARGSHPQEVKKDAVFWLGNEISRQAGEELERMAGSDPEVEIQKQAVFAISRRGDDESIPSLIRIARDHPRPEVRKQAVFWLGQKRDSRVIDFFEQMLKK